MRVVFWGTYDLGKPRTRILLRGLRENGVEVIECHADVWRGVEDKGNVRRWPERMRLAARWFLAYPGLLFRYLRLPRHDAVIVGYLGHFDVLILWPIAKLRGTPIVWDAFLSLYETVVEDRALIGARHPVAALLFGLEWLACRAADRILLDTQAHADYFAERYRLAADHLAAVFVGVEPEYFPPRPPEAPKPAGMQATVLFYGQFIPLHGVDTIVRAAAMSGDEPIDWVLIGRGQEEGKIRRQIDELKPKRLTWIPWVPYEELKDRIWQADICLGIFGDTAKAARVIPNKVFQVLSCGVPLITRDSPAMRELLPKPVDGIRLVPPADEESLLRAVQALAVVTASAKISLHDDIASRIAPMVIGAAMIEAIDRQHVTRSNPACSGAELPSSRRH